MKNCSVFASLISPSKMILFEKKYQTFNTVFHHQMKHLEVRQKYSAASRIFNSLLGVSSGDETLRLMFDILHKEPFPIFCNEADHAAVCALRKRVPLCWGTKSWHKPHFLSIHFSIYILCSAWELRLLLGRTCSPSVGFKKISAPATQASDILYYIPVTVNQRQ